ncbi:MAG: DUF4911 domain-containing protein [Deltaproteobacteria bacterium]|nr:DUF4911 domain-containing protein [Deltaproteobacteria bacterium]
MQCKKKYLRVDRREIGFMKFIFEGYDGIANMTTIDSERGVISINIPDGCDEYVNVLIKELKRDIFIEPYTKKRLT